MFVLLPHKSPLYSGRAPNFFSTEPTKIIMDVVGGQDLNGAFKVINLAVAVLAVRIKAAMDPHLH